VHSGLNLLLYHLKNIYLPIEKKHKVLSLKYCIKHKIDKDKMKRLLNHQLREKNEFRFHKPTKATMKKMEISLKPMKAIGGRRTRDIS